MDEDRDWYINGFKRRPPIETKINILAVFFWPIIIVATIIIFGYACDAKKKTEALEIRIESLENELENFKQQFSPSETIQNGETYPSR